MKKLFFILSIIFVSYGLNAQTRQPHVKNIIFMIGDGMGLAQVSAAMIDGNYAPMALDRAQFVGLAKTYSANNRVTDSAAAGTALATGTKTNNGAIGMDPSGHDLTSVMRRASKEGFATGVVVTCYLSHATPAAFIAHEPDRENLQEIAADYLESGVDVAMGGGMSHFVNRRDGRDLIKELGDKGYTVATTMEQVAAFDKGRIIALLADEHMPSMAEGRGDYLQRAVAKTLDILSKDSRRGFFLMVEGSQIDFECHANKGEEAILETLDFDKAIKTAFDFADRNPGTLVVVTADHETGGMSLPAAKTPRGVAIKFSTGSHSGTLVPVYAYGAGAERFSRVMDNTELPKIMAELLKLN